MKGKGAVGFASVYASEEMGHLCIESDWAPVTPEIELRRVRHRCSSTKGVVIVV